MLDFKFCIRTGNFSTVSCRKLVYGFYENKIMTKQIVNFKTNGIITNYEGAWRSLLLLATKKSSRTLQ